jgi:hypothetical protein
MALTNAEFAEKYFPKFGSRLDEVREQSKQDFLADLAEHDKELLSQPIYAAMHNPNIHESTWGVIGLYRTRKGAEMAVEFAKHTREEDDDEVAEYENYDVFEYLINDEFLTSQKKEK